MESGASESKQKGQTWSGQTELRTRERVVADFEIRGFSGFLVCWRKWEALLERSLGSETSTELAMSASTRTKGCNGFWLVLVRRFGRIIPIALLPARRTPQRSLWARPGSPVPAYGRQ
jgi:hypothetical protein